jgi:2-methylcitrate dehydratase PrpD
MDSRQPSVTAVIAAFAAAPIVLPEAARSRAVDAMTDGVGCMLAGAREPLAAPLLRTLPSASKFSVQTPAVMAGTGRYAAPGDAALFNGAVGHALDFDDTNHPAYAHPTAVLLPAMLAVAPRAEATGAELVTAYVIGFDLIGKLGRALNTAHYARGWHTTSSFGSVAATLAAARVLRLDRTRIETALGIAASSSSGLRANFGTMVKPLHAGLAARNGVMAALLAAEGFDAASGILERQYGYCSTFNDGLPFDLTPLMTPGEPLEILTEYGLALKPYPSCGATHPGIEAALALHADLQPGEEVTSMRAGVSEMAFKPLIHRMPSTPLEAKFSLHFCLAAALVDGFVDLSTFDDRRVNDVKIRALIDRTTMEADDRVRHDPEFATVVAIETNHGRKLERLIPLAQGKPERWMSDAQLKAKFATCAERSVSRAAADAIFARVRTLDKNTLVADLCAMLSGAVGVN